MDFVKTFGIPPANEEGKQKLMVAVIRYYDEFVSRMVNGFLQNASFWLPG